jgi:hypothetical protein
MRPSRRSTAFAVARTNENPVAARPNLHSQASKGHPVETVLDQNTENQAPNDLIANFAFQAIHEDCATS